MTTMEMPVWAFVLGIVLGVVLLFFGYVFGMRIQKERNADFLNAQLYVANLLKDETAVNAKLVKDVLQDAKKHLT